MIYFAYGSNMYWPQMRERCPSASFMGRAVLKNHSLKFTRKSTVRNCGVADIVPSEEDVVWGVLYRIDESDLGRLDESEGYNPNRSINAYIRREVLVMSEGDEKQPITATAYTVQGKSSVHIPPNSRYHTQLLQGAEYWKLPPDYIAQLKKIEVQK